MPEVIQNTFRDSPLLLQWYSWGVIVSFFFALGVTLWLFVDAQRNGRDDVLWKSLAAVATVLAIPALLARLHGGFAVDMRDSLGLIAALSVGAVLLAGAAAVAYALSGGRVTTCPTCLQPLQPGWSVCPRHQPVPGTVDVSPAFGAGIGGGLGAGVNAGLSGGLNDPIVRPITAAGSLDDGGSRPKETVVGNRHRGFDKAPPSKAKHTVVLGEESRPKTLAMLLITSGQYAGVKLDLTDGRTTIGSSNASDRMIDDDAISSVHLSIKYEPAEDAFVATDLDSTNGTFVNGRKVDKCRLQSNDIIKIGRTQLQFIQVTTVPNADDTPTASTRLSPAE